MENLRGKDNTEYTAPQPDLKSCATYARPFD